MNIKAKINLQLFSITTIIILLSSLAYAQSIPPYIHYQGRLLDKETNSPITQTKYITFSFYNTEAEETPIYYQSQEVSITNGIFIVFIGKGEGHYDGNIITDGIPTQVFTEHSARYLGIKLEDSQNEMKPRQLIATAAYAFKATEAETAKKLVGNQTEYLVPPGTIVMWSGIISSIPTGWTLCDGTNGTPDLRERFVIGSAPVEDPGATGGTNLYKLNVDQLPSHTHHGLTSSAGNHSHSGSTSVNGEHRHKLGSDDRHWSLNNTAWIALEPHWDGKWLTDMCWPAGNHNHSINTNSTGSHSHSFTTNATGSGASIDNRPAYYALAFIMKL